MTKAESAEMHDNEIVRRIGREYPFVDIWVNDEGIDVRVPHLKIPRSKRRQGYGTEIVQILEEFCEENDKRNLDFNIRGGDNTEKFFETLGYEIYRDKHDDSMVNAYKTINEHMKIVE